MRFGGLVGTAGAGASVSQDGALCAAGIRSETTADLREPSLAHGTVPPSLSRTPSASFRNVIHTRRRMPSPRANLIPRSRPGKVLVGRGMKLLSIFKSTRSGAGYCIGGPDGFGAAAFSMEARDAIEAADILPRDPDDEGARVFVRSHTFHGSFRYSRNEAAARIQKAFPELSASGVRCAVSQLENRVLPDNQPARDPARRNWVHDWRRSIMAPRLIPLGSTHRLGGVPLAPAGCGNR